MFFHRNISHGWVPPALSTEEQLGCRLKKEKPSFTPSKVLLMFEYLFLIRKVHFEEATGVGVMCVCVCACVARKRANVGGCREKNGLVSSAYSSTCV